VKHKKKGRKIYTYQARNRRVFSDYHPVRSAIGTAVTLVLIGVIGFVGYNVVGPIVTRLHQEELSPTATAEPYFTETPPPETAAELAETVTTSVSLTTVTTALTTETVETTTTDPFPARFAEDVDVARRAGD